MALSDKNIVITPNVGSANDPQIVFSGADASSGPNNITLKAYPTSNGTISLEGSSGQLFSVSNDMTGTIFSVNDVSGIPSIDVNASGAIRIAPYGGTTTFGGPVTMKGAYTETSTVAGVYGGIVSATPRLGFFNGTAAQNWQIDNSLGTFRWYLPGVSYMELGANAGLDVNNTTSGWGAVAVEQTFRLAANGAAIGPASANYFGATSAISLEASAVYEINYYCKFLKTTAAFITFIPTASSAPTSMIGSWVGSPSAGITAATVPGTGYGGAQGTTSFSMTATGALTTGVNHAYRITVTIQTNAATNLRLNVTNNAGTITPLAGSYYTVKKIATTTGTYVA